jgi:transcription elongation GreA/GreB family factor
MQSEKVQIGSWVQIKFFDGRVKTFTICNSASTAEPELGVIFFRAPLAAALLGHSTGEHIKYQAAGRLLEVEIMRVESMANSPP